MFQPPWEDLLISDIFVLSILTFAFGAAFAFLPVVSMKPKKGLVKEKKRLKQHFMVIIHGKKMQIVTIENSNSTFFVWPVHGDSIWIHMILITKSITNHPCDRSTGWVHLSWPRTPPSMLRWPFSYTSMSSRVESPNHVEIMKGNPWTSYGPWCLLDVLSQATFQYSTLKNLPRYTSTR